MTAIIFDTETTGLVEPIQVIEIAWEEFTFDPYASSQVHKERFKPSKPIEWGALSTHHIHLQDLVDCRPHTECQLPNGLIYLIGHNVDFDWSVMGKPPIKRIDTLALCRALYPDSDSHKLGAMYYYIFGTTDLTRDDLSGAHAAADDVFFCRRILLAIIEKVGITSLEALWKLSEESRIPTKMTFGKHRGKLVSEVDAGYVAWYRRQPDPDPYLLMAFSRGKK